MLLPALFALAACGSDDADSDTAADDQTTPSASASVPAGAPECADLWKDGGEIPRAYQGCVEEGVYVKRDAIACSSGQFMIRYADRYYAFNGGTVFDVGTPLDESRDYRAATRRCTA